MIVIYYDISSQSLGFSLFPVGTIHWNNVEIKFGTT